MVRNLRFSGGPDHKMVLERFDVGRLDMVDEEKTRKSEAGITLIEVLMAAVILTICSLGMMGLISTAIATNTRNKFDSTTTMLAGSIIEHVNATLIGSGSTSMTDCANNTWTINTAPGGAALIGANIDFTETAPPADYHMNYVVKSPCTPTGIEQAVYDLRWHISIVGAPSTPTNTYLLTVGAQMKGHGE